MNGAFVFYLICVFRCFRSNLRACGGLKRPRGGPAASGLVRSRHKRSRWQERVHGPALRHHQERRTTDSVSSVRMQKIEPRDCHLRRTQRPPAGLPSASESSECVVIQGGAVAVLQRRRNRRQQRGRG